MHHTKSMNKLRVRLSRQIKKVSVSERSRDLLVFLFFVGMSAIFWYVQELGEEFNTEVSIPLHLTNVPEGVLITTDLPKEVTLTVHGKGTDLLPLIIKNRLDTLALNFRNFDNNETTGKATILLTQLQRMLKRPALNDVTITGMTPDTLFFHFNRGLHKRLPVCFQGTMEASRQYAIASHRFQPDSVDVYAPLAVLDTMTAVFTTKTHLSNQSKSARRRVALMNIPGVKYVPEKVQLYTEVDVLTRQSLEVPIIGLNFPADKALRTFPSTVRVNYLATIRQHEQLDESLFVVAITYEELIREQSANRCHPHLTNTPEGISGALIDPVEVDYLIENISTDDVDE